MKPGERALSTSYRQYRRRLLVVFLLVALFVIGLVAWKVESSFREREVVAREQTRTFVPAIQGHVQQSLQFIDLSLVGFSNAIGLIPPDQRASAETIRRLLSQSGTAVSDDYWTLFIDARGIGVAASNNLKVAGVDYADRDYFRVHRDASEKIGLYVGEPDLGRVSKKRIFFLSRRVDTADGTFLGVIAAPIEAERFAGIFKDAQFKEEVSIALMHKSGKVIARIPRFEASFAADIRGSELYQRSMRAAHGSYDSSSVVDGERRVYSYRTVDNLPLVVSVGISSAGWVRARQEEMLTGAAVIAAMLLTMLLCGRFALKSYLRIEQNRSELSDAHERLESRVTQRTAELVEVNRQLGNEISERRQTTHRLTLLEKSIARLNDIVLITEALPITGHGPRILFVNDAFERRTGYPRDEVLGRTPRMLQGPGTSRIELDRIREALARAEPVHAELLNYTKGGQAYWVELDIVPVSEADGVHTHFVSVQRDITEKRASQELIWKQANLDSLTGLPNRHMFLDRLDVEIKRAHRTGNRLALMYLDLDRFKEVNDVYGHDVGDGLLAEAAQRLRACVRESDTVARLGGDEFTILLSQIASPEVVARIAENILARMAQPFQLGLDTAYISASIGITLCPDDGSDVGVLLKNADQAMYAAKNDGRARYRYFTARMQEAAHNRMRMASDLRAALPGRQFELVYQPIVELASGHIGKAEALIRWRHPQRGMVSPGEFIPVAEDTGVVVDIGNWVFREAARQTALWRAAHHPQFQISINASPAQFRNDGIDHAAWVAELAAFGLPGNAIAIEITERLLLDVEDSVKRQLLAFRDAGMQVSLDDFGTGYSSLSYLKKFDIDIIKIDQSFVVNLRPESEDMTLCEAIIVMAHRLGLKVVAEGIETVEQRDLLQRAGCDYGQGYLFSRPVDADAFARLLPQRT